MTFEPDSPTLARRVGHAIRRQFVEPAVPILLIAAAVQVMRHAWVDLGVFAGGALLIVLDNQRTLSRVAAPLTTTRMPWPVIAAILAFGALVALLPRTSAAESAIFALPGVVAALVVLRFKPPRGPGAPPSRHRGLARFVWVALGLALALVELSSFLSEPSPGVENPNHPTVSDLVDPLLATPWSRGLIAVLWLSAGLWLIRRVRTAGRMP